MSQMKLLIAMMVLNPVARKVQLFSLRTPSRQRLVASKVSHHSVEELLENIFKDRLEDGQLDSVLTWKK